MANKCYIIEKKKLTGQEKSAKSLHCCLVSLPDPPGLSALPGGPQLADPADVQAGGGGGVLAGQQGGGPGAGEEGDPELRPAAPAQAGGEAGAGQPGGAALKHQPAAEWTNTGRTGRMP